jgi:hypothetical protein
MPVRVLEAKAGFPVALVEAEGLDADLAGRDIGALDRAALVGVPVGPREAHVGHHGVGDDLVGDLAEVPLVVAVVGNALGKARCRNVFRVHRGRGDLVARDALGGGGDLVADDRLEEREALADTVGFLAPTTNTGRRGGEAKNSLVVRPAVGVPAPEAPAHLDRGGVAAHPLAATVDPVGDLLRGGDAGGLLLESGERGLDGLDPGH